MRFKATLTTEQVAIFSNVVKELESIGNKAALYLCGEGIIILISFYVCYYYYHYKVLDLQ